MQKELMIPAAILLGSLFIAAGLYLGLQRPPPPPALPSASVEPSTARAGALPATAGAPAPSLPVPHPASVGASPVTSELYKRVEGDAAKGLEGRRSLFVKQCWEPSLRKNPAPARARYIFNMTFDASGNEIARGISEVRGMDRPDAAQCLRMMPLELVVPPPGTRVSVEIEMTLP
ncbi:hypothetical protein WMF11_21260 [Sorangium sp. So ce295]|uniref:hypothetical protein n=1 Tax=Sorangium sp. So ce295 TaxID=3133295 RepID=UPI003F60A049